MGLTIALLILLLFNLSKNKKLKDEIKNQCGQLYNLEKERLDSLIEREEISHKRIIDSFARERSSAQEDLDRLRSRIEAETKEKEKFIDGVIVRYKRNKQEEADLQLSKEYDEKQKQYRETFDELIENLELQQTASAEEVDNLTLLLDDLRSKYNTIIEGLRKEEELKNEQDFYRINLTNLDKEDIIELQSVSLRIHNREIINKLIWEVYYSKPYTELVKRVCPTKTCGVYRITNLKTNKSYIGKSTDIANRWKEHIKSSLDIGSIAKARFHTILKEDGVDTFVWQILEACDKDKYSAREHYWIDFFQTQLYGYNEKS